MLNETQQSLIPPDQAPPLPGPSVLPPGLAATAGSRSESSLSGPPPLVDASAEQLHKQSQQSHFIREDKLNDWIGTTVLAASVGDNSGGYGIIIGANDQQVEVQVAGASSPVQLTWDLISWTALPASSSDIFQESPVYAPFANATIDKKKGQAHRLRVALQEAKARKSLDEAWPDHFWKAVAFEKCTLGLEPLVQTTLEAGGYHGDSTLGQPKDSLEAGLLKIIDLGGFFPGSGPEVRPEIPILPDWLIKEGTLHTTTEVERNGLVKPGGRSPKGDGKQKKGKGKKDASAKGAKGE